MLADVEYAASYVEKQLSSCRLALPVQLWIRKKLFYLIDSQYLKQECHRKVQLYWQWFQGIIEQSVMLKINRQDEKNSGEKQWHKLLYGHASYWLNLFKQNLPVGIYKWICRNILVIIISVETA